MDTRQGYWVNQLVDNNYVVFQVDSLGPRKINSSILCQGDGTIEGLNYDIRAQDAYDAKAYLASLPYVDGNQIGLIGFSHGGITAIVAAKKNPVKAEPFAAVLSFYPYCFEDAFKELESPLMVIIGEKDDWTPAGLCRTEYSKSQKNSPHETELKVLSGLYHCFDCVGVSDYLGHELEFSAEGRERARQLTEQFLEKHFK